MGRAPPSEIAQHLVDAIGPHAFKIDLRPRNKSSIVRQIELFTGVQAGGLNGHMHDVHGLIKAIRRLALQAAAAGEGLNQKELAKKFGISEATVYQTMKSSREAAFSSRS